MVIIIFEDIQGLTIALVWLALNMWIAMNCHNGMRDNSTIRADVNTNINNWSGIFLLKQIEH